MGFPSLKKARRSALSLVVVGAVLTLGPSAASGQARRPFRTAAATRAIRAARARRRQGNHGPSWTAGPWTTTTTTPSTTPTSATSPSTTTTTAAPSTTTTTKPSTAPSPSTTTTSAPPPAPTGCAANPHRCGFPDATTTGVPAGHALTAVPGQATSGSGWHWDERGFIEVDTPGAVVDGVDVGTTIDVTASNVTIKNSRVIASGQSSFGIMVRNGAENVTIQDCEIRGVDGGAGRLMAGIQYQWLVFTGKVLRVNISRTSTGIQANGGLIRDSYIHDMGFVDGDHLNGITSNADGGLTVVHNTVLNGAVQTDAVSLFEDFGAQANDTIDNNLLAGGGYVIYGGEGSRGPTSNIKITNNRIGRLYFPNGGYWGWLAHFVSTDPGNVTSGNVWDDTGQPVS